MVVKAQTRGGPIIGPCPSCAAGSTPRPPRRARTTTRWPRLVADLRARQAAVAGRGAGGDDRSIARHRERGKLPVRERIERLLDPGSAFLELSPLAATGLYDDDAPGRRDRHRRRPRRGHDLRRRRQRRHGQGRHLLPDDGQEAPPRPGDRAREPAAVHLPGRLAAARSCRSRPRSSPTATTSAGSSTTRRGCRPPGSRRSRWSWARARPAAPTCRR